MELITCVVSMILKLYCPDAGSFSELKTALTRVSRSLYTYKSTISIKQRQTKHMQHNTNTRVFSVIEFLLVTSVLALLKFYKVHSIIIW